jgi:hypothetical protein
LAVSIGVLPTDLGLLGVSVEVSSCLGALAFPGLCFTCPTFAFFSFRQANPDSAFLARQIPPTPETRCPGSPPAAGKPEILAPCSGVSVSLTPKREVPGFTSGRFLTTGLSLPLAEISAEGSLIATGPLNSAPELPAPC